VPGSAGHVPIPCRPNLLFGVYPEDLIADALGLAALALDAQGRALRQDGSVLVAGVVSYPQLSRDTPRDPIDMDVYGLWRTETRDWLAEQFGDNLRSVVEHVDEDRFHLHFYVIPSLNPDRTLNWERAHPGLAAKRRAAAAGKNKREQERCYRAAMRDFQDEFFSQISLHHGHSRYGAKRERVSRIERAAQKRIEAEREEMHDRLRIQEHEVFLRTEHEAREQVRAQMHMMKQEVDGTRQQLEIERDRADRAEEENARLRALLGMDDGPELP
jgi:hypothetical protein